LKIFMGEEGEDGRGILMTEKEIFRKTKIFKI
jgi:hypothetical protein